MPRDPRDISVQSHERQQRRIAEADEQARLGGYARGSGAGAAGPEGPEGKEGPEGPEGKEGPEGATGRNGGALRYTFSSSTTYSDPGSGVLRFNNTEWETLTSLWLSETDGDAAAVGAWLDSFAEGGALLIRSATSPNNFFLFNVTGKTTDEGTWRYVPLERVTHNGSIFANETAIEVFYAPGGTGGGKAAETLEEAGLGVVYHGSEASTARPTGFSLVLWIGTVEPENAAEHDPWLNPNDAGIGYTDYGLVSVEELEEITPATGDRAKLIVGGGLVWDLIADGDPTESGSPWAASGPAIFDFGLEGTISTESTSYVSLTDGPTLEVPIAGVYLFISSYDTWNSVGTAYNRMSYQIGETAASDTDAPYHIENAAAYAPDRAGITRLKTLSAAATVTAKFKVTEGQGTFYKASITVEPRRVG